MHTHNVLQLLKQHSTNKMWIRICWYFISEVQQSKEVATYCWKQVKMLRNYTCTMRFIVSDMKWICKAISPDSYIVQYTEKKKKLGKKCKDFFVLVDPKHKTKEYMMTSIKDITFLEMPWRWQKSQQFVPTIYIYDYQDLSPGTNHEHASVQNDTVRSCHGVQNHTVSYNATGPNTTLSITTPCCPKWCCVACNALTVHSDPVLTTRHIAKWHYVINWWHTPRWHYVCYTRHSAKWLSYMSTAHATFTRQKWHHVDFQRNEQAIPMETHCF